MSQLFTNNASGTLSIQLADETGPSLLTLQTNEGSLFPSPTGVDFFVCTVEDTVGNFEILLCTDNSGSDVLTCTRAQESTSTAVFPIGSKVEIRNTAATFDSFLQVYGGVMQGELDMDGGVLRDPLITDGEARNLVLRGTDGGVANELDVPTGGADPTIGGSVIYRADNLPSFVPETREIVGAEGVQIDGDLSVNRTAQLDFAPLAEIAGTDVLAADRFVVYDVANTTHKAVPYKKAGVPIIVDNTVNPTPTDDEVNAYWVCSNASPVLFDIDIGVGEKGNVIIVQQGAAGQVAFTGGTANIKSAFAGKAIRTQDAVAVLVCTATDEWTLYGDCA